MFILDRCRVVFLPQLRAEYKFAYYHSGTLMQSRSACIDISIGWTDSTSICWATFRRLFSWFHNLVVLSWIAYTYAMIARLAVKLISMNYVGYKSFHIIVSTEDKLCVGHCHSYVACMLVYLFCMSIYSMYVVCVNFIWVVNN